MSERLRFESRQEWWERFCLLGQISVLALISVSLLSPEIITAVASKRSWPFCQKCMWQVTAKHTCTQRMWFCMREVHCCVKRMCRDGSSFRWHQPCKNQTVLLHHFSGYSNHVIRSDSNSFRITCYKSTVSLLKRGE